jgi:O-antigen/teichoic acid export membrane protein
MLGNFRNKIVFGVVSGWGAQIVSLALGIFTMPLFFRYLPKDELGVWMFILGTSFFVNLADLGFSPVLGRQLSFELGKGDGEKASNYEGASFYFNLSKYVSYLTAPVLFLGLLVGGGLFFRTLNLPEHLSRESLGAWGVFCFSQAVVCRFKYLETTLNSHGEVGWQNWVQMILQAASLAGYFIVLHFWNGGIMALSAVILARTILNVLLLQRLMHNRVDAQFRRSVKIAWHDVKPHINSAMDMFFVSLGAFLILNTDQYFIVTFLGTGALPDYAAAYRLVQVAYVLASTSAAMSMPFISRASAAGDHAGVHRLLMLNTTVGMLIQIAAVSVIAVFGDHILELWLGKGHFVGWSVLWVFCIMLTLENHHVIFSRFGVSAKNDPTWGKMSMLAGAMNLVFTFVGVKWLGLLGVALGTMITQMLTNNWYAVAKTLSIIRLRFSQYFRISGMVWSATGLLLMVAMVGIRSAVSSPIASVLIGASCALLISGGMLFVYLKRNLVTER